MKKNAFVFRPIIDKDPECFRYMGQIVEFCHMEPKDDQAPYWMRYGFWDQLTFVERPIYFWQVNGNGCVPYEPRRSEYTPSGLYENNDWVRANRYMAYRSKWGDIVKAGIYAALAGGGMFFIFLLLDLVGKGG